MWLDNLLRVEQECLLEPLYQEKNNKSFKIVLHSKHTETIKCSYFSIFTEVKAYFKTIDIWQ